MNSNQKLFIGLFIVMLVPVLSMTVLSYDDFMRPVISFADGHVATWQNTLPLYQVVLFLVGVWSLFLVIVLLFLRDSESSVASQ